MMNNKESQYKVLLHKYIDGTISDTEKVMLMDAIASNRIDHLLEEELKDNWSAIKKEAEVYGGALPFEQSAVFRSINPLPERSHRPLITLQRLGWAAAVIVVFVAGLMSVWRPWAEDELIARVPGTYLHQSNEQKSPQNLRLPDGSNVLLLKGATVYYPERFEDDVREVYLIGDAFFEVRHMDGMRFSVHGRALSAEVLGTSFWVRQDESVGKAEVEVRTGKVRVKPSEAGNRFLAPVIVSANQQVAYKQGTDNLQLTLADTLLPLHTPEVERILQNEHTLRFKKATKLGDVLSVLSKVYGVEIDLSSPELNNCLVTGDLSGQDLLKSIDMICLSIGTTYERRPTSILISGTGCALN